MSTLSQFRRTSGRFRANRRFYTIPGSYTFTVPDGVTEILAVAIGGGGGGAKRSSNPAGGGGGGGYSKGVIAVTPGQTIAVTVGGGGEQNNSNPGGTSSFGSFCSSTGLLSLNFFTQNSDKISKS